LHLQCETPFVTPQRPTKQLQPRLCSVLRFSIPPQMASTLPPLSKDIFEFAVMDRIDAYAVVPASSHQLSPTESQLRYLQQIRSVESPLPRDLRAVS
jgi:hypothetical protein